MSAEEERAGVRLTNLDQPLFEGADATKRDLVDYLDAVAGRIVPQLAGRPLSVIRVLRGQKPFMQKNLPKYTPEWVRSVKVWAETSRREVAYALCDDRRTLLWFANQRAVEYHPPLFRAAAPDRPTHLVIDIDPPEAGALRRSRSGVPVPSLSMPRVAVTGGTTSATLFVSLWDLGAEIERSVSGRTAPGPSSAVLPQLAVAPARAVADRQHLFAGAAGRGHQRHHRRVPRLSA